MITKEQLQETLTYDPKTGMFTHNHTGGGRKAGSVAGGIGVDGYWVIRFGGKQHLAHRAAILYQTGEWPSMDVDHINGNRSDNRIVNLRVVSRTTNLQNLHTAHKDNSSGMLGVVPNHNRFSAQIRLNGKNVYLGNFETAQEAHEAYLIVKRNKHLGCAI